MHEGVAQIKVEIEAGVLAALDLSQRERLKLGGQASGQQLQHLFPQGVRKEFVRLVLALQLEMPGPLVGLPRRFQQASQQQDVSLVAGPSGAAECGR